jgi:UrcA family protein
MTADSRLRPLITAALGCILFSIVAEMPAVGDTASNPPTMTAGYSDLNVSQSHGATVLYGRIRTAAQMVCTPSEGAISGFPSPATRACVRHAICVVSPGSPRYKANLGDSG